MDPQPLPHPHNQFRLLAHLPDPRHRHERRYPLAGRLGMLIFLKWRRFIAWQEPCQLIGPLGNKNGAELDMG